MALKGKTNEEKIWNYLYSKINNEYGVAGLMGNLKAESALNPINLQNTGNKRLNLTDEQYTSMVDNNSYTNFVHDSIGYGLAQWTYYFRKQNLLNYSRNRGVSIGDLEMQLDFLVEVELKIGYKKVWNTLVNASSVQEASDIVLTGFERPANQGDSVKKLRASYGQAYFDKYAINKNATNKGGCKMKINTHAGHNPDGKVACGAVGYIKESTEARRIQSLVNEYLRKQGHTVYDCTVDNGTSQNDVLKKIVSKCNAHEVDLDISIHFNATAKKTRDGKTTGTEAYIYSSTSKAKDEAQRICNTIAEVGFTNRGVKNRPTLYVLRKTKSPALLIEVCYVDDPEDVDLYNANIDKIARKIVKGITGVEPTSIATTPTTPVTPTIQPLKVTSTKYSVQSYLKKYYGDKYKEVFGEEFKVDGVFGAKSRKMVALAIQVELNKLGANLKIDGDFGSGSTTAFIKFVGTLKKGSKGIFVTLWQCLLVGFGYNPNGIDGDAGNGFVSATNKCLKAYGLSGDSVVNGSDINKIL